jgi:Ig-like domain from next to BRCA1 gene
VRMVLSPVIILTLAFVINGCSPRQPAAAPFIPPQIETPVSPVGALSYTPPPLPNALEQTPTSSINQVDSTAQSACSKSLRFIEDVNYPDGTAVRQGEKIEKLWRVENNGTCSWDSRYRMRLVEGDQLGAPVELALFPARPGTQAELRVIFIAPRESRTYRSTWQAYGPDGLAFGDPFYIDIFVQSP